MRIRVFVIALVAIFLVGLATILFPFSSEPKMENDSVLINDITKTAGENFEAIGTEGAAYLTKTDRFKNPPIDYAIIDLDGRLLAATRHGISEDINSAIKHGDTIVDVESGGVLVGKIIFYNDTASQWHEYKKTHQIGLVIVYIIIVALVGIFLLLLHRRILKPFRGLQKFASKIAGGDLDAPLSMDRGNVFGAFTESFDLMRAELYAARENEREANQSKKELVASLSHDVKTPVASIKAISELMLAKAQGDSDSGSDRETKELEQLKTINAKADQIDLLVTNMFHATLEELEELKVNPVETSSVSLARLIEDADYRNLVTISNVPECLVWADTIRLVQVFDNILGNSYKYADTRIRVEAEIADNYLVLNFADGGKGVASDELPLLAQKFYRGSNATEKSGSGLGLYISSFFMTEMRGTLACANTSEGFSVKVSLALV